MHIPAGKGTKEIVDAIVEEFGLRCGDVTATTHQPEPFLIRFEHRRHADEVRNRKRFKRHGMSSASESGAASHKR